MEILGEATASFASLWLRACNCLLENVVVDIVYTGALPFFSSDRTMRIRVSGSTSATKSPLSSVSVTLSCSESNGVKWYG